MTQARAPGARKPAKPAIAPAENTADFCENSFQSPQRLTFARGPEASTPDTPPFSLLPPGSLQPAPPGRGGRREQALGGDTPAPTPAPGSPLPPGSPGSGPGLEATGTPLGSGFRCFVSSPFCTPARLGKGKGKKKNKKRGRRPAGNMEHKRGEETRERPPSPAITSRGFPPSPCGRPGGSSTEIRPPGRDGEPPAPRLPGTRPRRASQRASRVGRGLCTRAAAREVPDGTWSGPFPRLHVHAAGTDGRTDGSRSPATARARAASWEPPGRTRLSPAGCSTSAAAAATGRQTAAPFVLS